MLSVGADRHRHERQVLLRSQVAVRYYGLVGREVERVGMVARVVLYIIKYSKTEHCALWRLGS